MVAVHRGSEIFFNQIRSKPPPISKSGTGILGRGIPSADPPPCLSASSDVTKMPKPHFQPRTGKLAQKQGHPAIFSRKGPRRGVCQQRFVRQNTLLLHGHFPQMARPFVLENGQLIPARILEQVARPVRNLKRSTFWFPALTLQLFRSSLQVLNLKNREA